MFHYSWQPEIIRDLSLFQMYVPVKLYWRMAHLTFSTTHNSPRNLTGSTSNRMIIFKLEISEIPGVPWSSSSKLLHFRIWFYFRERYKYTFLGQPKRIRSLAKSRPPFVFCIAKWWMNNELLPETNRQKTRKIGRNLPISKPNINFQSNSLVTI